MNSPTQPDSSWLIEEIYGHLEPRTKHTFVISTVGINRLVEAVKQHEAQAVELARIDELVGVLRDAGVIFKNGKMSHRYKFIGLMFIFNRLAALRAGKENI